MSWPWKLLIWFRNNSIKRKIMIIFIPFISIPLFVLAFVSNYVSTESVIQKTFENVAGESLLIVTRIQESILNAENAANILTLDLNKIIPAGQDEFANNKLTRQIPNQFSLDLLFFPDIEAVAFLDMNQQLYTSNSSMEKGLYKAYQSDIIKEISTTSGENVWFTMESRDFLTTDTGGPVLTLGKKILSIDNGDQLGTLILIIKESSFSAIYESVAREGERNYMIVDSTGQVISSLVKENLLNVTSISSKTNDWLNNKLTTDIVTDAGKKYLVTSTSFEKLNWRLLSQIPLDALTKDNRRITWIIVLFGILGIAFSFFGAEMLSRVIAKPLIHLTRVMLNVKQGKLNIHFDSNTTDEVGFLTSGFNKMLEQIRELIEQVGTEQKQKRHYELALIQSQIKPHFLYNTLDLVYVLCAMNRIPEAQQATKALADFYRIALSGGKEVISIVEEFDNVTDYLAIQKIRYIDVFDFSIHLNVHIQDYKILKLTIQPLVENAIYHGLKPKETKGKLDIKGDYHEGDIWITVSDNGVGISPERCQTLLKPLTREQNSKSFGLLSVSERIKLYFGNEYGISIHSVLGEGTTIAVKLPARKKEEMDHV
ncbi:sensor histidine kinase [Paenibacillus sp. N3.4]|uniref:sensor histidine kinase n=1 Tax=Paenibacillus sp. N3.4 TaxID=2603222 RepID=UPI00164F60CE|nr:sensor histidine kinase [Paenibacillus sp. N3.4]